MIQILPGILEQDLEGVRSKIDIVAPYVSWLHIDVCDNTMVQNKTFLDFEQWKGFPDHLNFEAHLMVAHPEKYIRPLVNAGFKRLIAHLECEDPRRFLEDAEFEEVEVGLAVDGPTAIEEIEPFVEHIDVALIMGYEAGFSGQPFQLETIDKIKALRHSFPEVFIEVDGGINGQTAPLVKDAGAKRLVTTSYLFSQPSQIKEIIEALSQEPS